MIVMIYDDLWWLMMVNDDQLLWMMIWRLNSWFSQWEYCRINQQRSNISVKSQSKDSVLEMGHAVTLRNMDCAVWISGQVLSTSSWLVQEPCSPAPQQCFDSNHHFMPSKLNTEPHKSDLEDDVPGQFWCSMLNLGGVFPLWNSLKP